MPGTSSVTDHEGKKPLPGNVEWHSFRYHFPAGGVLGKTLSLEMQAGNPTSRRRIETQLLHFDGETWRAYSYAWRDDGSDADLVPADGAEKHVTITGVGGGDRRTQTWAFNSRSQCMQCHNAWAEYALGFSPGTAQPRRRHARRPANQLASLERLGLLKRMDRQGKPKAAAHAGRVEA